QELSAQIARFDLKGQNAYTVRERETEFVAGAKALHEGFEAFLGGIDRNLGLHIDRNLLFNIADIVEKLGSSSLYSEFGLTKDKVDKLLSIKNLIVEIHKSELESAVERERKLEKDFIRLKEKTFGESVRSAGNRNAGYYFKSVELLKKSVSEGALARIVNDDLAASGNEIGFRIKGEQRIVVEYALNGLEIVIDLAKSKTDSFLGYAIEGHIQKALSLVEFRIDEQVSFSNSAAFERVTGIEFLWAQFEKAYLDFQQSRHASGKKQEDLDRQIVDKAIDDLLFS
ncbi:MAG TPA: hypothetical protein VMC79_13260, partial [Rectinemataceae bacterium]|nr:hypothetical protein [Rectinemataceae bacterium]